MVVDKFMAPPLPVFRQNEPPETKPPWTGLVFIPDIGSDELSERLRVLYPHLRTLQQRKHQAAIEFLRRELEAMQASDSAKASRSNYANLPSVTSPHSETNALHTTSRDSSTPQSPYSSATSGSPSPALRSPVRSSKDHNSPLPLRPSTPNSGGQHFVFHLDDGRPVHVKTKRKMSKKERISYKETRKRGACMKCKKNKAKCTHQLEPVSDPLHPEFVKQGMKRRKSTEPSVDTSGSLKLQKSGEASDVHFRPPESNLFDKGPGTFNTASFDQSNLPAQVSQSNRTLWSQNHQGIGENEVYVSHTLPQEHFPGSPPEPLGVTYYVPQDFSYGAMHQGLSDTRQHIPGPSPNSGTHGSFLFPPGMDLLSPQWPGSSDQPMENTEQAT